MDPTKSNLEPIEESDLNLENKFRNGIERKNYNPESAPNIPLSNIENETPKEVSASEKDDAYAKILSKIQAPVSNQISQDEIASDAEKGSRKMDAETQIQHLVDLAQQKGIVHAVKVARHMEDNYLLDAFHDRMLADELHDALLRKGMIKEI